MLCLACCEAGTLTCDFRVGKIVGFECLMSNATWRGKRKNCKVLGFFDCLLMLTVHPGCFLESVENGVDDCMGLTC